MQTTCSKRLPEFACALDGELAHLEVVERVFALQILRERDALRADVDPDYLCARPAQRVVGGLHGAAAGYQNASISRYGSAGQKRCESARRRAVVPEPAVGVQVVTGGG